MTALAFRIHNFLTEERGDTNFISMLLIIGIVLVLAGMFLAFGQGVMDKIKENVMNFVNRLHA